jgi:hypothetical protein
VARSRQRKAINVLSAWSRHERRPCVQEAVQRFHVHGDPKVTHFIAAEPE